MAEQPTFKPGDIVRLKSGGPPLTVSGNNKTGIYFVFFKDGDLHEHTSFSMESALFDAIEIYGEDPETGTITWQRKNQ